mmetsp:Transcript_22413/g.34552  ORF Transcript_22413/g.34552 Transcript_22413/m.34552 type:complete len:406 (-) Transcript_22413:116-1333(-)
MTLTITLSIVVFSVIDDDKQPYRNELNVFTHFESFFLLLWVKIISGANNMFKGIAGSLVFAATAVAFLLSTSHVSASPSSGPNSCASGADASCELFNSAFVFVKPHANTEATRSLVKSKLLDAGIQILKEYDIDGPTIDKQKLIDQHYYAIASKATLLSASEIPVPLDKFQSVFGESWTTVLKENRAMNAMEACDYFECTPQQLDQVWNSEESTKMEKLGGGFYCGLVDMKSSGKAPIYVFNAFFMTMRSKFVGSDCSIHCYQVQWNPTQLTWSNFRNKLLGPTDPSDAPEGSIRRAILDKYQELGLTSVPNKGDNGVHASASPLEGLAEQNNWLSLDWGETQFGKALIDGGLSTETLKEWSKDPQVELAEGGKGSIFDALEDLDAPECLAKMIELNQLKDMDTI